MEVLVEMISFNINLKNLNKSIENYRNNKKKLLDEINSAYENLKNTDVGWNDANSVVFLEKIKKDKYEINNYFANFDKLYLEIENFKNRFNNIFNNYGYKSNSVKLKFNENYINVVLKKMDNVMNYLSSALYYINLCNFNNDFDMKTQVQNLVKDIKTLNNNITIISSKINTLKRQVNSLLIDSQQSFRNVNAFGLNITTTKYNWSLQNSEIQINKLDV